MRWLRSVSYTHLDVYKRQVLISLGNTCLNVLKCTIWSQRRECLAPIWCFATTAKCSVTPKHAFLSGHTVCFDKTTTVRQRSYFSNSSDRYGEIRCSIISVRNSNIVTCLPLKYYKLQFSCCGVKYPVLYTFAICSFHNTILATGNKETVMFREYLSSFIIQWKQMLCNIFTFPLVLRCV